MKEYTQTFKSYWISIVFLFPHFEIELQVILQSYLVEKGNF